MKTLKSLIGCFLVAFGIVALPELLLGLLAVVSRIFFPALGLVLLGFLFSKKKEKTSS